MDFYVNCKNINNEKCYSLISLPWPVVHSLANYNIDTWKVAFLWILILTSSFKLLEKGGSSESELTLSPEIFLDVGFITLIEWELLDGLFRVTFRQCRIHGLKSGSELKVVSTRVEPCPFSFSMGLEISKSSQTKTLWKKLQIDIDKVFTYHV